MRENLYWRQFRQTFVCLQASVSTLLTGLAFNQPKFCSSWFNAVSNLFKYCIWIST